MEATSVRFANAARVLAQASRRDGLVVPGFRSPPRLPGVDRSVRQLASGQVMISVRLRDRPWTAVVSDMVEGVLVANRLAVADADAARRRLWACLDADALLPLATPQMPVPRVAPGAPRLAPTRVAPARSPRLESDICRLADPAPDREAA